MNKFYFDDSRWIKSMHFLYVVSLKKKFVLKTNNLFIRETENEPKRASLNTRLETRVHSLVKFEIEI